MSDDYSALPDHRAIEAQLSRIAEVLAANSEDWQERVDAMNELKETSREGKDIPGFDKAFASHLHILADPLVVQLSDLRSEVTGAASALVSFLAGTYQQKFARTANRMISKSLPLAGTAHNLIRAHVQDCLETIVQFCSSRTMLEEISGQLHKSKSKYVRGTCADLLIIALERWPMHKYKSTTTALETSILYGLKAPNAETRTSAAKCFVLFLGHFPGRRESLYVCLDSRTKRMVDKAEEEADADGGGDRFDSSYEDTHSTPRSSRMSSRIPIHRRSTSVMAPNSASRARPSMRQNSRDELSPSSSVPENKFSRPRQPIQSSTPTATDLSRSRLTRQRSADEDSAPAARMERAATIVSSSRRAHNPPQSAHRDNRDTSSPDSSRASQIERPYSTSSVGGRRRSPADRRRLNSSSDPSGGMRRRPSLLSNDEKHELTELYNEHQSYLANSAVNLKQLHAALTNRLETPVSQYTSSVIALLQKQADLVNGLKVMFVQYRRNSRERQPANGHIH